MNRIAPVSWERYLTPTPTHRGLGMSCFGVGRQESTAHCPPRTLDYHAAVLILSGQGRLEYGQPPVTRDLTPPVLFWLFPGEPHTYGPSGGAWREIWTLFGGAAAAAYEELGYLSRADPVMHLDDATAIRHTMDRLVTTCDEQRPGVEAATAHLVHELVLTMNQVRHDPDGATDAAVVEALRNEACTPTSVDEFATRFGLSSSALRRVVHRATGCAPKEYIMRVRLNHAKSLLAGSDRPVAQIARDVGHHDPAYFTRMFTLRTGMSPREFRRQQRRTH